LRALSLVNDATRPQVNGFDKGVRGNIKEIEDGKETYRTDAE
jgi:hypothetical protein